MPKQKAKLPVNPTEKEQIRYNAVLLEEIRSQTNAVIETVDLTRTTLEEKIDGVEKRLTDRIEIVEMVVKANSAKLQEHDLRFEKIDQRFDGLEKDVKEIKQKLDDVAEKVERHDEEIVFLKSAVTQN